ELPPGFCRGALSGAFGSPRDRFRAESRYSRQQPDSTDVLAPSGGRSGGSDRELARLLCGTQEGWSSCRNARVRKGRTCVWAAPHGVPNYAMAAAGRDVAKDDRDDLAVSLPDARRPRSRAPRMRSQWRTGQRRAHPVRAEADIATPLPAEPTQRP